MATPPRWSSAWIDLESLEETLDVLDSAALPDDIREALADSDAQVLSKEDALRLIAGR